MNNHEKHIQAEISDIIYPEKTPGYFLVMNSIYNGHFQAENQESKNSRNSPYL